MAAIRHMTASGIRPPSTKDEHACANGADAKKRGNIIPPGSFPSHARAVCISRVSKHVNL